MCLFKVALTQTLDRVNFTDCLVFWNYGKTLPYPFTLSFHWFPFKTNDEQASLRTDVTRWLSISNHHHQNKKHVDPQCKPQLKNSSQEKRKIKDSINNGSYYLHLLNDDVGACKTSGNWETTASLAF